MAKTHSTAERIEQALRKAGGSLTRAQLAAALPDVADANRSYHAGQLRKKGRIHSTGTTVDITWHLGPAGTEKAADLAHESRKPPASLPTEPAGAESPCTRSGVTAQHLRRLLALALRAPDPITDADREALAAVAEEALA